MLSRRQLQGFVIRRRGYKYSSHHASPEDNGDIVWRETSAMAIRNMDRARFPLPALSVDLHDIPRFLPTVTNSRLLHATPQSPSFADSHELFAGYDSRGDQIGL